MLLYIYWLKAGGMMVQFLASSTSVKRWSFCVEFCVLPGFVWVFCRYSSFLSQSKDIQTGFRFIRDSCTCECESESIFFCLCMLALWWAGNLSRVYHNSISPVTLRGNVVWMDGSRQLFIIVTVQSAVNTGLHLVHYYTKCLSTKLND